MITTLIYILIVGLIFYIIYFMVGRVVGGIPLQVLGIILTLIFILYVLGALGIIHGIQ
jgi:hypothetical protein